MARYRTALPQLARDIFLTDGGIETTLVFHDGLELPHFAAFDLLRHAQGRAALRRYFDSYVGVAREHGLGLVLESATWRANPDWAARLGYSSAALADANRTAVALLEEVRADNPEVAPIVISGCVGPRGDGYDPGAIMSEQAAQHYHAEQIDAFAGSAADLVTAITMTNVPEAIGVARAARAAAMPVVISFTVETDGRLPAGDTLAEAIERVDAATERAPAYFMINCAHPTHFEHVLAAGGAWLQRLGGLRANASIKSHAELDAADTLDDGDPVDLGARYRALRDRLPQLVVLGGCCGTDHRHIAAISAACTRRHAA
jgi:S-methylmethionine-dependent homocysteine/selenocysteine methylase